MHATAVHEIPVSSNKVRSIHYALYCLDIKVRNREIYQYIPVEMVEMLTQLGCEAFSFYNLLEANSVFCKGENTSFLTKDCAKILSTYYQVMMQPYLDEIQSLAFEGKISEFWEKEIAYIEKLFSQALEDITAATNSSI